MRVMGFIIGTWGYVVRSNDILLNLVQNEIGDHLDDEQFDAEYHAELLKLEELLLNKENL